MRGQAHPVAHPVNQDVARRALAQIRVGLRRQATARHHIRRLVHPPLPRIVLFNPLWHKSAVSTFLEKFVLTILVALFLLIITNPMHLGVGLRVGGALGTVIGAYFCGRAIHKQAGASRATAAHLSRVPNEAAKNLLPSVVGPKVATAAEDADQLREKHGVARLRETQSGKTFAEIPPNSFCFMYGHSFIHDYKAGAVVVDKNNLMFEVHKFADGTAVMVAYVGPETRDRLLEGLKKGETLTIYSRSCEAATNVIAVPVDRLKFNRDRILTISKKQLCAVDCEAR